MKLIIKTENKKELTLPIKEKDSITTTYMYGEIAVSLKRNESVDDLIEIVNKSKALELSEDLEPGELFVCALEGDKIISTNIIL